MAKMAKTYPDKRGFFEMVRFDFVLDSKLGVYLMEVNMSPNLSSGHFAQNRLLYEQAVYTLLRSVYTVTKVCHCYQKSQTFYIFS